MTFLLPETLAWSGGFKASSKLPAAWVGDRLIYQNGASWQYAETSERTSPHRLRLDLGAEISPDGVYVSSPKGARLAFFDGERIRSFRSDRTEEGQPALTTNLPLHLAVSDDKPLSAWIEGERLRVFWHDTGVTWEEPAAKILGLSFSPDGRLLACRTEQGVEFVHPETRRRIACRVRAPSAGPSPLAFSGDGRWLAVCGSNHEILLGQMPAASAYWAGNGALLNAVFSDPLILQSPSPKRITSLAWNSTGSRLAGGTADGFVQSWNLSLLRRILRLWDLEISHDPVPSEPEVIPITLK
jgi:WD40 repeat protein